MKFITNGPDIPDELIQAHENGNVIFFCGAGISYPAGLPDFKGLVNKIYKQLGTSFESNERYTYKNKQYDSTLDLLERRYPGQRQRLAVRKALSEVLKPNLRRKGAIETHSNLLQLANNHDGILRIVTTNFDRLFETAIQNSNQIINTYIAPMLPIPKKSRWNGLVYLHGLLPENIDDNDALQHIVVSSGDFGLAYFLERWATRFVSGLFKEYTICFIGYSINDPVLRYMMDALAADRMLGEESPQVYAFGGCKTNQESKDKIEWEAKGVIPILYPVNTNHSALYDTIKSWANTYRDGTQGKKRIVVDYAFVHPASSTQQDHFIGKMLWALSDNSGLPARVFSDLNPAPPLEWLNTFSDNQKIIQNLTGWLVRHLNNPELILWLVEQSKDIQVRLSYLIMEKLIHYRQLKETNDIKELKKIQSQAADAIPEPFMQTLWRLFLTKRIKTFWQDEYIYEWQSLFNLYGLTTTTRLLLREILAPKVNLIKRIHNVIRSAEPSNMNQLVDWELVLTANYTYSFFSDFKINNKKWQDILPQLFSDFQQLLRDALDLLCELGEADEHYDQSYLFLPSINPDPKNRGYYKDWVLLIELLRDAWLAIFSIDSSHAIRIAYDWFNLPYSTFKRLALFAASTDNCITSDQWVDWLLSDDAWLLWRNGTDSSEVMRLFELQGKFLSLESQDRLESAILAGPSRKLYKEDFEQIRN